MCYGAGWADVFAAATEDYTAVRVNSGFLFAVGCLCFEGMHVAELYAFAAGGAFGGVYFGVPWDFAAWDSFVVVFFAHCASLLECGWLVLFVLDLLDVFLGFFF